MKKAPLQRIPSYTPPEAKPVSIRCYDCGQRAQALLYPDREALPAGWTPARVWLRTLYTCPACGEKRRRWVLENVIRRESK